MNDDDLPDRPNYLHTNRSFTRQAAREMNSNANARLAGTPSVDLAGKDFRTASRAEVDDVIDKLRSGTRSGQRTLELSRRLWEEKRAREFEAFQAGMQNRRD